VYYRFGLWFLTALSTIF